MATFGIFTLGCKVNQYESEAISELLEARGYTALSPNQPCDLYIINTCTVTAESDRKARQMIRRAISKNPDAYILVTGCLAETDAESVRKISGVDYICGNADKTKIADAAVALLEKGKKNATPVSEITDIRSAPFEPMSITKFDRTRAYIKIEDGCESHCTYCIIPHARGKIRSKSAGEVLREVRTLTDGGCREVVLTGIETASWGKDLGASLIDLLEEVDKIPNICRVRLGSLDPSLIKAPFVERIAKLSSLAPHFHLSLQSGSNKILALMKRKYNAEMALRGMEMLRDALPHVQFTTDIILGFPHEGEAEFLETLDFIEEAKFLMIHAFPYSKRKGTPAAEMDGQVPESVRHERVRILSAKQQDIRRRILSQELSLRPQVAVLFEDYKNGFAFGHTDSFVPVRIPAEASMHSVLAQVVVESADDDGLIGHLI